MQLHYIVSDALILEGPATFPVAIRTGTAMDVRSMQDVLIKSSIQSQIPS